MKLTGKCLCGAVRYSFEGTPTTVVLCHCRDCQRASGSLFHYGVMVPEEGFRIEGELRSFASKSDAGRTISREFCPVCGSGVLNRLEVAPKRVVLRAGTLDDALTVKPVFEIYTRSRPAWLPAREGALSFEADATGPRGELRYRE
jgi:hypothetical protein